MKAYKNIVFDLGGVVFMRDMKKCTQEFIDFFSFVRGEVMPHFWNEYDRGTLTIDQAIDHLMERSGFAREKCASLVADAIAKQIAQALDISKERVRQIERQAMDKLQKIGASLGLEDFLE